jgi:hypothetical protein
MCYELRFFRPRAKSKVQEREENKLRNLERSRVQPIRPEPTSEVLKRKDAEREIEEFV